MQDSASELRRIPLPRTPVNRLASDTPKAEDKCVIQHTVLYDTDLPDDPCYTRYLQTTAIAYGRLISVSVMCVGVDASSSRLFKGSAPQNGGYRVQ